MLPWLVVRRWRGHGPRFRSLAPLRCLSVSPLEGRDDDDEKDATHPNTSKWGEQILPALRTYKELKGDTLVPTSFVVPTGDERWPKVAWGYTLGRGVRRVRHKLQAGERHKLPQSLVLELEELEFAQTASQGRWDNCILPALRCFYEIYKHSDVPRDFVVPHGDKMWPKATWNLKLGAVIASIRWMNMYATQVAASMEELKKMDFCLTNTYERDWSEKVLPSLATYRQEFGDCLVGRLFIVPSQPPWSKKAWGLRLGQAVSGIRSRKSYKHQVARDAEILESLEFVWDAKDFVWNNRIVAALKVYAAINGHCRVHASFVVPSHDPWPKTAWGMRLGDVLNRIRWTGCYFTHFGRDAQLLESLGLSLKFTPKGYEKRVSPLLETYASIKGSRDIPDNFIISPEDPWPEQVWGVHLGLIVARNAHHFY